EATNLTVEMSEVASGQAYRLAVASFRGLAGKEFRRFAFDRTGQRFLAIATGGSIQVQNVATPDEAITVGQYEGTDAEATISPDGSLVAVIEPRDRITIYSSEDGSNLTSFQGPQNASQLAFDESGKR